MSNEGWIVLSRINGSAESIGPIVKIYENRAAAELIAIELANKRHGQMYVVAKIVSSALVSPKLDVAREDDAE